MHLQPQPENMYRTTTMLDYQRQPMENLERGSSGVESLPYEMLFGHGKVQQLRHLWVRVRLFVCG